jgi:hypothetical protein
MELQVTDDEYSLQVGGVRLKLVPIYFGAQNLEQLWHGCELPQVGQPAVAFHGLGTDMRSRHTGPRTMDTKCRLLDK